MIPILPSKGLKMGVFFISLRFWTTLFMLQFAVSLFSLCEGKITSLNNKFSPFQTRSLAEVKINNNNEEKPESVLEDRIRRDTSMTPSRINVDTSYLQGTEKHNQAFVHWIGKETSEKVIVLTCQSNMSSGIRSVSDSKLWRSDDYGSTFHAIPLDSGAKLSYIYTFSNNSQKLLFTDVKGKAIYKTSDEATNLSKSEVPIEPDIVLPHPTDDDKILVYSLTERKLFVSHDFGTTWSLLSENVLPRFYWGTFGYDKNVDIVHMEIVSSSPDKAEYKACISPSCTDVTSEMGPLGPFLADTLIIHKEYMIVQKSNLTGSDTYLMISYKRQPFKRAFFPGNVKTNDFILLNLDDGQIFIAGIHDNTVNLYLSDLTGHFFVLSFSDIYHVVQPYWVEIDFHEVKGMNWTFIVNKKVPNTPNGIVSYISFDKGGHWGKIKLNEDLKKYCKLAEDCHLQLNIKPSPVMTPAISSKNAPGLMVAHGTLASAKHHQPVSIFTSRDGGWTWKKAPFEGIHNLNILDQGSVLTAIPDGLFSKNRSKILHFSCDEGNTWKSALFDNRGFMVNGVLTEPEILTLTETLFGHEGDKRPWVLIKLNFSLVLQKKCESQDYESWFPEDFNDVTQNNCTMGQLIEYKRRKQNAMCHNGETLIPRLLSNDSCECTKEDYECDFGYEEKGPDCTKAKWYYEGYLPVECKPGDMYRKSQGYRKVSSDVCEEKEAEKSKYGTVEEKCTFVKPRGLSVVTHSLNVAGGAPVPFYLSQTGGSLHGTKYTWNFGDGTAAKVFTDYESARQLKHAYRKSGHFKVTAVAENSKGKATSSIHLHVQDKLRDISMLTPLAGKVGLPVTMTVAVLSQFGPFVDGSDHVHFLWTFGDENATQRPLLTWDSSVTHTYDKKGLYQVSVEAVNSVGSFYEQFEMHISDDVEILVLKCQGSSIINMSSPILKSIMLQRLHNQLSDDLGVGLDRMRTAIYKERPLSALLYIYPSDDPKEDSIQLIKKRVMDLVKTGNFGFSLFGKRAEGGLIIRVVSAEPFDTPVGPKDHHGHGPNMKAVFICAPVLLVAVIFSIGLLCYCRRKRSSAHQYSMLHIQDDSDALLDDEDDPPLDLNIDFRVRDSSRDVAMMDSGGSHLVMQDNVENC